MPISCDLWLYVFFGIIFLGIWILLYCNILVILMHNDILQTSALDGETDLKTRVIPSACMGIDSELLHKIKARFSFPYRQ